MPELPEVESLRLGLEKNILGSRILSCEVLKPKLIAGYSTKRVASKPKTQKFINSVIGKKIQSLKRIAKNIILEFTDNSVLIVHLKMTGQMVFLNEKNQRVVGGHPILSSYFKKLPGPHTGIIFSLNNGTLFYNDVRMFGYVLYYENLLKARQQGHFRNIGLEPFQKEFTFTYFQNELKNKKSKIKTILLEQSIVTGCGNIYSDEVCFASKILPTSIGSSLKKNEAFLLYKNIKKILKLAIKYGGTSISDHVLANGEKGNFAKFLKVYGRARKPCLVCGTVLEKMTISGRTTVFCPTCQK